MILQIAAGVCLGIVAAVLILNYWRRLLRGSMWLLAGLLIVAAVVAGIAAAHPTQETVATWVRTLLIVVVAVSPSYLIVRTVDRRYPAFAHGRPPWNTPMRSHVRTLFIVVMVLLALTLFALLMHLPWTWE